MFPFKSDDEVPADPQIYEQQQQQQDLMVDNELLAAVNMYRVPSVRIPPVPPPAGVRGRGRSRDGSGRGGREEGRWRSEHRETERQRRQEMASLLTALRSLLPPNSLEGKRSMSEHIEESANYIKQLEGRIKELRDTKEHLLRSSSSHHLESSSSSSTAAATTKMMINSNSTNANVEVFQGGLIQVLISCHDGSPLTLSTSLKVLLQAGLDVVICVTTTLNGGALLHTIHCQVTGGAPWNQTDAQHLQHRLNQLLFH